MSIWLEIHCDVRSEVADPRKVNTGHSDIYCWSIRNDNPASSGANTQDAYAGARREANRQHWKRRRFEWGTGWVCPHCRQFPPALDPSS